jgi:hypothetical protein
MADAFNRLVVLLTCRDLPLAWWDKADSIIASGSIVDAVRMMDMWEHFCLIWQRYCMRYTTTDLNRAWMLGRLYANSLLLNWETEDRRERARVRVDAAIVLESSNQLCVPREVARFITDFM